MATSMHFITNAASGQSSAMKKKKLIFSGVRKGWGVAAEAEVKSRLFSFNMRPSREVGTRALRKVSLRAPKFRKYTHTHAEGMEMRRLQQKRSRRL